MKFSNTNSMVAGLSKAKTIFARHRGEVEKILTEYRDNISLYGSHYAQDYAAEKRREAQKDAGGRIAQADREMSAAIFEITKDMKKDFANSLAIEPAKHFLDCMNIYDKYHLTMTETEIRAFAEATAESHLGLRVLQKVAAKSGFKVELPSVSEVEADIARIERAARVPSMYAPANYYTEAAEVLGEKPYFRNDNSVAYRSGKVDALYLSLVESGRTGLETALEGAIKDRWNGLRSVSVTKFAEDNASEEERQQAETAQNDASTAYAERMRVTRENDLNEASMLAENAASESRAQQIRVRYTGK